MPSAQEEVTQNLRTLATRNFQWAKIKYDLYDDEDGGGAVL